MPTGDFSAPLSTLLAWLKTAPPRKKAPGNAARILKRRLAPDAAAFFQTWATHGPTRFFRIGDFCLDDTVMGSDVPPVGDTEQSKPPRQDVIAFGNSSGGDLFALKQNASGLFTTVVRIQHDAAWSERTVGQSLEGFLEAIERAARKANEGSTLREFNESNKPLAAVKPGKLGLAPLAKPKREPFPKDMEAIHALINTGHDRGRVYPTTPARLAEMNGAFSLFDEKLKATRLAIPRMLSPKDDQRAAVAVSPDGTRALIACGTSVHLLDVKTGKSTRIVQDVLFTSVAFLANDSFAMLRKEASGFVSSFEPHPDIRALWPNKKDFFDYRSPAEVWTGSFDALTGPFKKFPLDADWLQGIADGRILVAGALQDVTRPRRKFTTFFRWDGELEVLLSVKRYLCDFWGRGLFESKGKWCSPEGFEVIHVEEALAARKRRAK